MSDLVTEKVILLKRIKHGESDLILHALNSSGAKVHFYARGALKSKKRFGGGVLEPLNCIQAVYHAKEREGSEPLYPLQEAFLIYGFPKLREDYERLELAFHFVQMMSKVAQMGTVDGDQLYNLLGNCLKSAEVSHDLSRLRLHFEIKLLSLQGILPPIPFSENFVSRPVSDHEKVSLPHEDDWVRVRRDLSSALNQLF